MALTAGVKAMSLVVWCMLNPPTRDVGYFRKRLNCVHSRNIVAKIGIMDRLDALTIFAAVAEQGSFVAAARRLGRSPAAVTRAVAALEDRLGTRLLNRTTRALA